MDRRAFRPSRRVSLSMLAVVTAVMLAFPAGAWAVPDAVDGMDASDSAAAPNGATACASSERAANDGEVAVVFTNDVHCGVESGIGYAGVAAYVNDAKDAFGTDNVTLVDAGDAVQGDAIGTLTDGGAIVEIMNAIGYDLTVPGNHEFDYGMDRFFELESASNAIYLSCNFTDLRTGGLPLSPFAVVSYDDATDAEGGTLDVAYIGITTPETLTKSSPASFQDETGAYVYGFCEDETGEALYDAVQYSVDMARSVGADYVVAIGHLGRTGITDRWTSDAVIANTTGIDAFIDGHSHEQYVTSVENEAGEDVLLAQTGTKLASVGQLAIDPDADEAAGEAELSFSLTTAEEYAEKDAAAQEFIDGVMADFEEELARVVGSSSVALVSADEETGVYVRYQETNLGDLVADAYRAAVGADIGLANGGGVRSSIEAGDITYADLIAVQPFGNELCLVEATGQQILDALEMGASEHPEPSGGFLQVSGLTYEIRTDIESSVATDEHDNFVSVNGPRRVQNVLVAGEPIDPHATYTVASHNYLLLEGGDGMTMFAGCPLLLDSVMLDNQALITYITDTLGGVIGQEYANPAGAGRVSFVATGTGGGVDDDDPSASDPSVGGGEGEGSGSGSGSTGETDGSGDSHTLAQTGDSAIPLAALLAACACAAGAIALGSWRLSCSTKDCRSEHGVHVRHR